MLCSNSSAPPLPKTKTKTSRLRPKSNDFHCNSHLLNDKISRQSSKRAPLSSVMDPTSRVFASRQQSALFGKKNKRRTYGQAMLRTPNHVRNLLGARQSKTKQREWCWTCSLQRRFSARSSCQTDLAKRPVWIWSSFSTTWAVPLSRLRLGWNEWQQNWRQIYKKAWSLNHSWNLLILGPQVSWQSTSRLKYRPNSIWRTKIVDFSQVANPHGLRYSRNIQASNQVIN